MPRLLANPSTPVLGISVSLGQATKNAFAITVHAMRISVGRLGEAGMNRSCDCKDVLHGMASWPFGVLAVDFFPQIVYYRPIREKTALIWDAIDFSQSHCSQQQAGCPVAV